MKSKKNTEEQMKVHLNRGIPSHINLRRKCDNRDRSKYKTVADFLAAAVEEFGRHHEMKLYIDANALSDEKREALSVLMSPDK